VGVPVASPENVTENSAFWIARSKSFLTNDHGLQVAPSCPIAGIASVGKHWHTIYLNDLFLSGNSQCAGSSLTLVSVFFSDLVSAVSEKAFYLPHPTQLRPGLARKSVYYASWCRQYPSGIWRDAHHGHGGKIG